MAWYTSAYTAMMTGALDLLGDEVTAYLVTSAYTPNLDTHSSISDVPSSVREESATVSGRAVNAGALTASPTTFPAADGAPVSAVVLTANDALVAYINDFGSGPGQTELALNGSDVTVNWPESGIVGLRNPA